MQNTLSEILHLSFQVYSFLLRDGLRLIEHPLVFHGCRISQRIKFSFHGKYLCYFEYFQKGNGLLRCHLVLSA